MTASTRLARLPGNVRGALWMLAAATSFSVMNVLVKVLGQTLPSLEIAFFRSAVGLLILLPALAPGGVKGLEVRRPWLHLLRGGVGIAAMFATFHALTHLPLATAVAIFFAKPLFMIVLAVTVLGETVRWRRWLATLAGFAGVLVMLRPDAGGLGLDMASAVLAAFLMSVALTTVKTLTATERPVTVVLGFGLVSTLVSLPAALLVWVTPTALELLLLGLVGVFGGVAQWLMVRAYRVGEATAVTPVDYLQLLFAGLAGFVLFGEVPDLYSAAGAVLIVASTLYIVQREARLRGGGG